MTFLLLRLIDRYILKQILLTLVFSLITLSVIFIIVNFMDRMDNFIDAKVSVGMVIKYYLVSLPEILRILTPISILVSCLFTVGKLSNNNEITAIKSSGMGLYRLLAPISFLGLLFSASQYYFNGWIVPNANEERERISQVYFNNQSRISISNEAFRDTPDRNVLINFYDANSKTAYNVTIENFVPNELMNFNKLTDLNENNLSENNFSNLEKSTSDLPVKLLNRIVAKTMTWDETQKQWILRDVIMRNVISDFHSNNIYSSSNINSNSYSNSNSNVRSGDKIETKRFAELPIELKISPRQLETINKKTNEMSFTEQKEYILLLSAGGKDVRKMEIEYYSAQALPLANFIVILFAVSFASVRKRGGLAVQIAAAMVIAFSYLVFFQISKPIGLAMNLSPVIVGWSANIIFIICGIISIVNTRT